MFFPYTCSVFLCPCLPGEVEAELLHTYSRIDPYDTLILCVRVAVLTAVTLTVPIVLFPVSTHLELAVYASADTHGASYPFFLLS